MLGRFYTPAFITLIIVSNVQDSLLSRLPELAKETSAALNPELMHRGKNIHPHFLTPGSNKVIRWKCVAISETPCGHEWSTTVYSRAGNKRGCPYCAGQAVHMDKRNALGNTHPELASEFLKKENIFTVWDITAGCSTKKALWKCKTMSPDPCGHEWRATPDSRSNNNSGCPVCFGQAIHIDGRNSLATQYPKISSEILSELNNGINPKQLRSQSNNNFFWKCLIVSENPCGHIWNTSVSHRTSEHTGCPSCSGREVHISGSNSLRSLHPELSQELLPPNDPSDLLPKSNKNVDWICKTISPTPCNHIWKAPPSSRTHMKAGCPSCSGRVVHISGRNSLAVLYPEISSEIFDNTDPSQILPASNKRLAWICNTVSENPCGQIWSTAPSHRTFQHTGCPSCANSGFNPSKTSFYYVIEILNQYQDIIFLKCGITNNPYNRLLKHSVNFSGHSRTRNCKLRLKSIIQFTHGHECSKFETDMLRLSEIRAPNIPDLSSELFILDPIEYIVGIDRNIETKFTYKNPGELGIDSIFE